MRRFSVAFLSAKKRSDLEPSTFEADRLRQRTSGHLTGKRIGAAEAEV